MPTMSVRFREIATGLASCVLLAPAGCKPPPADVSVDPELGGEPVSKKPEVPECKTPPRPAPGSSDDVDPPALINGRFVARDRVLLTFTEPLAPTKPVNPRQFRLSSAYSTVDYQAGYASGYYYDLGGNDSYQPAIVVIALEAYEGQPEVLSLQLNRPVPVEVCYAMRERQATIASNQGIDGSTTRARTGVFVPALHQPRQRGRAGSCPESARRHGWRVGAALRRAPANLARVRAGDPPQPAARARVSRREHAGVRAAESDLVWRPESAVRNPGRGWGRVRGALVGLLQFVGGCSEFVGLLPSSLGC